MQRSRSRNSLIFFAEEPVNLMEETIPHKNKGLEITQVGPPFLMRRHSWAKIKCLSHTELMTTTFSWQWTCSLKAGSINTSNGSGQWWIHVLATSRGSHLLQFKVKRRTRYQHCSHFSTRIVGTLGEILSCIHLQKRACHFNCHPMLPLSSICL